VGKRVGVKEKGYEMAVRRETTRRKTRVERLNTAKIPWLRKPKNGPGRKNFEGKGRRNAPS